MDTFTNDERREVAARLHEFADTDVWLSAMFAVLEKFGDTDRRSADVIADLIDPTCEMEDAGDVPASVKDNLSTFFCSECGAPVYNDMSPSYCPYCGARVVRDDG